MKNFIYSLLVFIIGIGPDLQFILLTIRDEVTAIEDTDALFAALHILLFDQACEGKSCECLLNLHLFADFRLAFAPPMNDVLVRNCVDFTALDKLPLDLFIFVPLPGASA